MSLRGEHLEAILDEDEPLSVTDEVEIKTEIDEETIHENSTEFSDGYENSFPEHPEEDSEEADISQPKDEDYDTDLEIEDERTNFHQSGRSIYEKCCKDLDLVPISYFIRHINERVLHMPHHGVGVLGAKAIAIPLVSNTSIIELDLEDNSLLAQGTTYLCEMLKENCYISEMNISFNNIARRGAKAVCEMLVQNFTLTKLNLSGNNIGDSSAEYIAAALLNNSRLGDLNLSHNKLGDKSGLILGQAIAENIGLEILDLSWNHFRGKSAIDLVDGIKNSSRLKSVNLAWNGLGHEGALGIADCVRNNHLIRSVDVTCNRITTEGACAIAKGLEANETLQSLVIGKNSIGAPGALSLIKSINNESSGLQEFDLTSIQVDKEFVVVMEEIQGSREFKVKHGGILSNYVLKGPAKKYKELPVETTADDMEQMIKNDPAYLINVYLHTDGQKLCEMFMVHDSEKKFKVDIEDLRDSLKKSCKKLTEDKVKEIVEHISQHSKDNIVNYSDVLQDIIELKAKM